LAANFPASLVDHVAVKPYEMSVDRSRSHGGKRLWIHSLQDLSFDCRSGLIELLLELFIDQHLVELIGQLHHPSQFWQL
jgi:hypothetical protein